MFKLKIRRYELPYSSRATPLLFQCLMFISKGFKDICLRSDVSHVIMGWFGSRNFIPQQKLVLLLTQFGKAPAIILVQCGPAYILPHIQREADFVSDCTEYNSFEMATGAARLNVIFRSLHTTSV